MGGAGGGQVDAFHADNGSRMFYGEREREGADLMGPSCTHKINNYAAQVAQNAAPKRRRTELATSCCPRQAVELSECSLRNMQRERERGGGVRHGDEPLNIRYDATATGSLRQAVAVAEEERGGRAVGEATCGLH